MKERFGLVKSMSLLSHGRLWKYDCKHRQEWLKKKEQAAEAGVALSGLEEIEVLMASYKDNTS